MYGIIYKITNLINGKIYIGQTIQGMSRRFNQHCNSKSKHSIITKSIKKYGKENFIIEQIDIAETQDGLDEKEKEWIIINNSLSPNGYNLRPGGNSAKFSEETKRRISNALTGKKLSKESIEKRNLTRSKNGFDTSKNTFNVGPRNKYKGVVFVKCNKFNQYRAIIAVNRKTIRLKDCRTEIEAAYYYNCAVDKYRNGEGYKNIIDEYELYNEINKSREVNRIGIHYEKNTGKWAAWIYLDGKTIPIDRCKSELDAKIAYNNYVIRNNLDKPLNWTDGRWLI